MTELVTVARPYAKAAFQYALESNQLDKWSNMLSASAAAVSVTAMRELLESPRVSTEQKVGVFAEVCGEGFDQSGKSFMGQLAQNKRLLALPMVSALYEESLAIHRNSIDVTIESAFDLSETEITKLSEALKKKLGKGVRVSTHVDKTLIGGVVIRAGDLVIDNSVRGKLKRLAKQLDS